MAEIKGSPPAEMLRDWLIHDMPIVMEAIPVSRRIAIETARMVRTMVSFLLLAPVPVRMIHGATTSKRNNRTNTSSKSPTSSR